MSYLFHFLLRTKLIQLSLLGLGLVLMGFQLSNLVDSGILNQDDFVEYWAAGRLNLSGANPYDPQWLFALQVEVWPDRKEPLMMWNPPWALALVMPFGFLDYTSARLLWLAGSLILVFLSINWIWEMYGGTDRKRWLGWSFGLAFMPTLLVLRTGQISLLLLAGLLGFLLAVRSERYLLAGVAVSLLMVKPHLLLIFWLALAVWVLRQRRYQVLFGCAIPLTFGSLLALAFNPVVFQHYAASASTQPPTIWVTATIGALLRLLLGPAQIWYQFIPLALGAIWFIWYWLINHQGWSWGGQMPAIVLVSLLSSPFGWSFDQVVLLLVIIPITVWVTAQNDRKHTRVFALAYFLIQAMALVINLLDLNHIWFVWVPPAFAVMYILYASRQAKVQLVSRQQS